MRGQRWLLNLGLVTIAAAGLTGAVGNEAAANSADLSITRLTAVKMVEDAEVVITATVANQGPQACGAFTLKVGSNCADGGQRFNPYPIAGLLAGRSATRSATFPLTCSSGSSHNCSWARAYFDPASLDSDPDSGDNYRSTNEVTIIWDGDDAGGMGSTSIGVPVHNPSLGTVSANLVIADPLPTGWVAVVNPPFLPGIGPEMVEPATLHLMATQPVSEYPVVHVVAEYDPPETVGDVDFFYLTSPGSEMWSDNFNDCDISDWEVNTSDGIFDATMTQPYSAPCGLEMYSQSSGFAWGRSPVLEYDPYSDYKISFYFMAPGTSNHWFAVMDNGHVHVVIDGSTQLRTWDGTTAQQLMNLTPGQWYLIECLARPLMGRYEVRVDGDSLGTASFLNIEANDQLRVGDIHSGSYDHGAGFWDDIVLAGVELEPDVDIEICDWPRPQDWWLGTHIFCDREEVVPGETTNLYAWVKNLGPDPATNVTVNFYASAPTLAEHFPDYEFWLLGSDFVTEIPPGDSVAAGPVPFEAPPGGNVFGEPYWTFLVTCDCANDPYTTGWPEEDNNVACKALWNVESEPDSTETMQFWIVNPETDTMDVVLNLDLTDVPGGWTVALTPPAGDTLTLGPMEKMGGLIEITTSDSGDSGFVAVVQDMYVPGGAFDRTTGGFGLGLYLTRNIFVHYNSIPTAADETTLGNLIGASKISYRCKHVPAICVRGVYYGLLDDILGLAGVTSTSTMYTVRHYLDISARAIKARASLTYSTRTAEDLGFDGTGINIAILDTGVDDNHPSLIGKYVAGFNALTNLAVNPDDNFSPIFHGTHCAGIAMGTGGNPQTYRGVAPGAGLIDVKVLSRFGSGFQDDVIQGIEWCIDNRETHDIRVLSMSLGSSQNSDGTDVECQVVNAAVDSGLVVVVAAGNSGPDNDGIGSPGAADKAITVASMDDQSTEIRNDDTISNFSNRGPRADDGDGLRSDEMKPEIAAPGGDSGNDQIMSARGIAGSQVGVGYQNMSGTSMACPHVAGVVALMLDANSSLTPSQVRSKLINTAEDWGPALWDTAYGHGYVDAYEAVDDARPKGDNSICYWYRDDFFWIGYHQGGGSWEITPGGDHPIEISVRNLGDLTVSPGVVELFYGNPTSSLHCPDNQFDLVGSVPLPALASGDSVVVGPINFLAPPGGNCFGQPFWSFVATVDCPDDTIETGWPWKDNNVSCRSNWLVTGEPGVMQEIHFWAKNAMTEAGAVVMTVDRDSLPAGWTAELVPPEGDTLSVGPMDSVMVTLELTPAGTGEGSVYVTQLLHEYTGRFVRITGGIAVTVDATTSAVEEFSPRVVPERFSLAQNLPNPFAPSTTIRFGIPREAKTTIAVYNVQGQRVRRILDERMRPGFHRAVWDGTNEAGVRVSSGIYFCVMRAGDFQSVKRMVLLK